MALTTATSVVAPLVGAWIETKAYCDQMINEAVAPLVGAWIETTSKGYPDINAAVAPLVGAWIETSIIFFAMGLDSSHPSWVRGLKQLANRMNMKVIEVAPLVGAWIETE